MYSVSSDYLKAFRKTNRVDRVSGYIYLTDGTGITISDSIIVRNKLSITRKICGTQFEIGTFNAAEICMTITADNAYNLNWNNARINISYELRTAVAEDGTETWETVPLGFFRVDGQQTKRVGNTVTLFGYDSASAFDVDYVALTSGISLWGALNSVCARAGGFEIALTYDEFMQLPNAAIVPDFSSTQVQSCRDVVMWIAHTAGGYAYFDSQNRLQIKRYFGTGGWSGADGDRYISASERTGVEFSDTETYLKYLNAYCDGEVKSYYNTRGYTSAENDKIAYGALSISKNPLLQALTADEQDAANNAYLGNATCAPMRYIKSTGWIDPSIELLDQMGFSGGNIDVSHGTITGIITEIKWKYRATGTIICNSFEEYTPDEAGVAVADDNSGAAKSIGVKSQTEKRIDGLEARLNSAGAYTTAINFRAGGFDLTFDVGGKSVTNEFSVAEDSAGNITSITNDTAERTIKVTYD